MPAPTASATQLPYDRVVLPSGVRVLTSTMPHTRSVTVGLYFGTGARYESAEQCGVSHFIEHMLFKGCASYPTAEQISETIESVGGVLNAATEKEVTVYWAKVASRHAALAFDLLCDMVQTPVLDPEEIEKEKRVVIDELNSYIDSPSDWVQVLFDDLIWPDQPLGRETVGTRETISAFAREHLRDYVREHYTSRNLVVAVAGDISHESAVAEIKARVGSNGRAAPQWEPATEATGQPRVRLEHKATEQAYLSLGGRALAHRDPDRFALGLTNVVLGEGMSSRLFLEVRERQGLAYDVHSFPVSFHDTGALLVSAGVDPGQLPRALAAVLAEVDRLRQHPVSATELRKAKEFRKGRLLLRLEDSQSVAGWYAGQELLTSEILTVDDVVERIEAVTPDDVLRVAQRVFGASWLNLAVIAPFPDGERARAERQFLSLLRLS